MKIQTTAHITWLSVDGKAVNLGTKHLIELEFSAIDTGGAFRDPILDFSFRIPKQKKVTHSLGEIHEFELRFTDPHNEDRSEQFSYEGALAKTGSEYWEANGRLKEDQLSREVIGLVLQLLR